MADGYQAIYDAVRSRISGGNLAEAVADVARNSFDISHTAACILQEISCAAANVADAMSRPSVLFRPTLSADGTSWCVLLGANLQEGVAGFGDTPDEAMRAFDEAFRNERTPKATRQIRAIEEEDAAVARSGFDVVPT